MKKFAIFLAIIFSISITSAFWLDYFANQRVININLNHLIEEQYETIYRQKQEINKANKKSQFWIFEANRRKK